MDLSLSVSPLIPSLQLPALLSWRVFVWHYFRLFVMGVLPETLFLLSVWHSEWIRPWFCLLLPHHHLKSCSVCISKMHIHIVFFPYFPLPFLPFCLKHVHASVSSICVTLPSILITCCSAKATFSLLGKNRYLFSPGSDSFFLVLSFHLFILSGWLYSFPSLFFSPLPFVLPSHLLFLQIFYFIFFSRSLLPFVFTSPASLCTRMCGKNPALGLHCLFHVRTSGDIKGL